MTNLLEIQTEIQRDGELTVNYVNLVGLTDNHFKDAIAFSAPALLAQQLCVLPVRLGLEAVIRANDFAKSGSNTPVGIDKFLTKYHSKHDLEAVPKSFDLGMKANLRLISRAGKLRLLVKPKIGLFSRFPAERMALLVANYQRYVMSLDLGPYQGMVPTAIHYISKVYDEAPGRIEAAFIGGEPPRSVTRFMTGFSLDLYMIWQTVIHESSQEI